MGLIALFWFLVRVIPKPSRAAYPCQRAAFPLASGFVIWLMGIPVLAFARRQFNARSTRFWKACLWGGTALAVAGLMAANLPALRALAGNPPHGSMGVAKGIFPGRVAWVHAPEATSWAGYTSTEHWYEPNHTDLATVEVMMSKAIQTLAGTNSDAAAWDGIFNNFNSNRSRGQRGYRAGEKIAIKINLTTCNGRSGSSTVDIKGTYEKQNSYSDKHWLNTIDNSPQMSLVLLRHLIYTVGAAQSDVYLGDPTGNFPKYMWDFLHAEFPDVNYFDNYGGAGRMRTEFSQAPFDWSTPDAEGTVQDYIPVPFAIADYIIDFAVLKGHSFGVTVCGKNLYGALLRCPDGYYRDANGRNQGGNLGYLSMHASGPDPSLPGVPGLGHYRAIVDLMGHPALGGKTLLCLVDGLFGGYFWDSHPKKWTKAPFNNDWPSSLFASLDPVAIDSVCYDFLLNEWPNVVNNGKDTAGNGLKGGAEDYLHEAALADRPASGTFYDPGKTGVRLTSLGVHEHWDSPATKRYSRNLGAGQGIELLQLAAQRPDPVVAISHSGKGIAVSWQASLGCRLQMATNPALADGWSAVNASPSFFQGLNVVTNDNLGDVGFYRLVRP
jgi:hypothetical protein